MHLLPFTISLLCTTAFGTCSSLYITLYILWGGLYFCLFFIANKYIHNIQIKHLHDTYIYKKQQIKLFSSKSSLINKFDQKITSKMLIKFSLIHFFCSSYYRKAATGLLLLSFLAYQGQSNNQLASLADSCITHRFQLFHKTPLILHCEHLQHFAKEICSSYFMSLPKSRYLYCEK